jgi:hypothetical protein
MPAVPEPAGRWVARAKRWDSTSTSTRRTSGTGYRGSDLFSPRDLATPLAALIAGGVPAGSAPLGL